MGFTKLKDRIDTLPLVLAGPIVRRVEPTSATVWVVLRRKRRVRMEVYDAGGATVAQGQLETRAIGRHIHMVCVRAIPATPFSAGTTYQYNLFFDHVGGGDDIQTGANLFGPRIVSAETAPAVAEDEARIKLTYRDDGGPSRPSFVLPPATLSDLRLLHGSCRKISGENVDALEAADAIIREALKTPGKIRPHMLFLTGDNIYNDGCERPLFDLILDVTPFLLGWDEEMPGGAGSVSSMKDIRWGHTLDGAGLTNTGKNYHLHGYGETIALYLLEFADALWPDDLDYQRRTFDFRGTLPAVRRALANLATYMIFDDHEFSNSWNLTADWVESVLQRDMGRRVYQNALATFALCQAWGNTPEQFETGPGKELLDALVDWSTAELAGTSSPEQPLQRIARSTGIPNGDVFRGTRDWTRFHGSEVVRWDYDVPCPGLNIEVLDTYMWRAYTGSTNRSVIITKAGLERQLNQQPPANAECSLIVVSNVAIELQNKHDRWSLWSQFKWIVATTLAALLFPLWVVLAFLHWLVTLFTDFLDASLPTFHGLARFLTFLYREELYAKYEHQTKGFELLLSHAIHRAPQQIAGGNRQGRVVFLSGDVHRSYCVRMEYWSRVPFSVTADPVEGVIAQLVGSPCKWVHPGTYDAQDMNEHHWAGWNDEPNLTWVTAPKESPWRFKESPWMTEYTPGANEPKMNPAPEWRYAIKTVPQNSRPPSVPLDIPDRPDPTLDEKLAELRLVSQNILTDLERNPVLKVNNLADVTFKWTAGSKQVIQSVWWRARPAVDNKWTISSYTISMDPRPTPPALPQ